MKPLLALLAGIAIGLASHEYITEQLAVQIIALDTRPASSRADAIRIARACMATKGAVATMHKSRSGNLKRVDCELRIKKEEREK